MCSACPVAPIQSFQIFVFSVIGGVSSVGGVLLGVAYLNITQHFTSSNPIYVTVVGTIPIFLIFVLFQGYFAKGITAGAVRG